MTVAKRFILTAASNKRSCRKMPPAENFESAIIEGVLRLHLQNATPCHQNNWKLVPQEVMDEIRGYVECRLETKVWIHSFPTRQPTCP